MPKSRTQLFVSPFSPGGRAAKRIRSCLRVGEGPVKAEGLVHDVLLNTVRVRNQFVMIVDLECSKNVVYAGFCAAEFAVVQVMRSPFSEPILNIFIMFFVLFVSA